MHTDVIRFEKAMTSNTWKVRTINGIVGEIHDSKLNDLQYMVHDFITGSQSRYKNIDSAKGEFILKYNKILIEA